MKEDKIRWRWAIASCLLFYGAMILAFLSFTVSIPLILLGLGALCFKMAVKGLVKPFLRSLLGA